MCGFTLINNGRLVNFSERCDKSSVGKIVKRINKLDIPRDKSNINRRCLMKYSTRFKQDEHTFGD